jgi:hypothetical protein
MVCLINNKTKHFFLIKKTKMQTKGLVKIQLVNANFTSKIIS